jgi:hypothetical protein
VPKPNSTALTLGVVAVALVLLATAVFVLVVGVSPFGLGRSEFAQAVARAPSGAARVSWTDWADVRREVGSDVDSSSSATEVRDFLDDAYGDLTSTSALLQSAPDMQTAFGFSPASVDWELFSQGRDGAVVTLGMPDGTDYGEIADRLETSGFPRPESETGVWAGGPDLLATIGGGLTPELSYVVLDAGEHLVLASDQAEFVETAHHAATGHGAAVKGLDEVADALGEPLAAAVYAGEYACGALAMGQADDDDQAAAAELVTAAGTVDPYTAFAMGVRGSDDVRVAMEFADDDQARANADSRAALATGPAVGQGGDFADRFTLRSASADGSVVLLDLTPVEGEYVLSDLSSGPVLFATC